MHLGHKYLCQKKKCLYLKLKFNIFTERGKTIIRIKKK